MRRSLPSFPDAMLLVNSLGKIVLVNDCTCKLFGFSQDKLIGQSIACLIPKNYQASHRKHLEGYFNSPAVRSMGIGMELLAKRADGSEFPVEISLSPYRRAGEVFAVAAIRDVTERMQLVKAQRESQRQAVIAEERARMVRTLPARMRLYAPSSRRHPLGSSRLRRRHDCSLEPGGGENLRIFVQGCNRVDDLESIQPLAPNSDAATVLDAAELTQRMELRDFEIGQRRKDGLIIDVSLIRRRFTIRVDHAGFLFLVDDISERKKIAQQLRQAQNEGGCRSAHRRHRARFQQYSEHHHLQSRAFAGEASCRVGNARSTTWRSALVFMAPTSSSSCWPFLKSQNLAPQKIKVNEL